MHRFIVLFALVLTACDGPTGDQGVPGPMGDPGSPGMPGAPSHPEKDGLYVAFEGGQIDPGQSLEIVTQCIDMRDVPLHGWCSAKPFDAPGLRIAESQPVSPADPDALSGWRCGWVYDAATGPTIAVISSVTCSIGGE